MRLNTEQKEALKASFKYLDSNDETFLFGSRVDDNKRGGDIDLLVYSQQSSFSLSRKMSRTFFKNCEEKLDVLVVDPNAMTKEQALFVQSINKEPLAL